jgi:hypothetical protein
MLSPDPAVRAQAVTRLDASFYHGKYYLYFGVVPAVFFFLPYIALTGQDPGENIAVLVMVAAGFLLYWRTYREAERRYFPGLSAWVRGCLLLLLAFGAVTPILLMASGFYEIPIAGGFLCLAALWLSLFHAWHSERRTGLWLGLASAAAGLAVGCRPTCLLALPVVALAAAGLIRQRPAGARLRLAAAAVLPVGLIGLALMAYNYARFDSPFEFGLHYQVNEMIASGVPLSRPEYLWANLRWYYLRPPALSPYFPYVFPMNAQVRPGRYYGSETIQGQLLISVMLMLCGAWLLRLRATGKRLPEILRNFLLLLLAAFLCLFLGVAFFGFRADRYMVDFQGTLILFLALAGASCAHRDGARRGARGWRTAFSLLAAGAALFNVLSSFQLLNHLELFRPKTYRFLAYYGNYPAELLTKLGLLRYGPIRFDVTFAAVTRPTIQPLLSTGVPYATDVLYAIQHPQGLVQFVISHRGYREYRSRLIPIQLGRPYPVEADLGTLYPPVLSPHFRAWTAPEIESLKTRALVRFAGEAVIHEKSQFFDSPPNWVFLGKNPAGLDPPFNGRISGVRRLPPDQPGARPEGAEPGVWRLEFSLPLTLPQRGHPILGSGTQGHGNLLLMQVTPSGALRFSLDEWGLGLSQSAPLAVSPGLHRLEIYAGPQVAAQAFPASWQLDSAAVARLKSLLRIWLDGALVWSAPISINLNSYDEVSIGSNPQGFSTADAYFLGSLDNFPYSSGEMQEFIARNLRPDATGGRP